MASTNINASNLNSSGRSNFVVLGTGEVDPVTGQKYSNLEKAKKALKMAEENRENSKPRVLSPLDPLAGSGRGSGGGAGPINMVAGWDAGMAYSNIERAKIALSNGKQQRNYSIPPDIFKTLPIKIDVQPTQMDDFMKLSYLYSERLTPIKTKDWSHINPLLLGDWAI